MPFPVYLPYKILRRASLSTILFLVCAIFPPLAVLKRLRLLLFGMESLQNNPNI